MCYCIEICPDKAWRIENTVDDAQMKKKLFWDVKPTYEPIFVHMNADMNVEKRRLAHVNSKFECKPVIVSNKIEIYLASFINALKTSIIVKK